MTKTIIEIKKVERVCPRCGKKYTLGADGIGTGCDACERIERAPNGSAWFPGETAILDGDGSIIMTREQAFGRKK